MAQASSDVARSADFFIRSFEISLLLKALLGLAQSPRP